VTDSQPDSQDTGDEFGDFDSPSKTSGDVDNEGDDDFGDFGGPTVTTTTTVTDSQPDSQDTGDEFGDFDSPSKTSGDVDNEGDDDFGDFGDFNTPDVKGGNDFGDFETPTKTTVATGSDDFGSFETPVSQSENTNNSQDDEFGDFGDFEDESSQQENGGNDEKVTDDDFGDFDDEEDIEEDMDSTDPEIKRIKDLLTADNKSKYKFGNFFTKKSNLVAAMSFPDDGADEQKLSEESGPTVFSRVDMTAFNDHFAATTAPSVSSQSCSPPNSASWCSQRVLSAVKDTLPPDALESASLSQDTYQSLRLQQQSAGPDPHLEVSTKPRKTSNSADAGFSGSTGKDMSTSGQAFQSSDAVRSSVNKTASTGDHAPTRHSAPVKSSAGAAGPSSAQAYLESLPDLSYMLTAPL